MHLFLHPSQSTNDVIHGFHSKQGRPKQHNVMKCFGNVGSAKKKC